MKKRICFLLALAVLITSMHTGTFASGLPEKYGYAERLEQLGLFRGTGDGYRLNQELGRAEAAALVVRMAGQEKNLAGRETGFSDVPAEHWGAPYVAFGVGNGYIAGVGDGLFEPEHSVKELDFAKMLLGVMGYKDLTLPEEITMKAAELEILTGYGKGNAGITRGDAVEICYRALNAETAEKRLLKDVLMEDGIFTEKAFAESYLSADEIGSEPIAWKVFHEMPKDKNYLFSPLSLDMSLAMMANGAEAETQKQILELLPVRSATAYNRYARELIDYFNDTYTDTLGTTNSIWLNGDFQPGIRFRDAFAEVICDFFDGKAQTVTRENAADTINGWLRNQSSGMLDGVMTQQMADDPEFAASLINTVTLDVQWLDAFKDTMDGVFTSRDGSEHTVPFMNQTKSLKYFENDDLKMVELPYIIGHLSMYVVLPKTDTAEFEQHIRFMEKVPVHVSLPFFRTESELSFKNTLKTLGVTDAFDSELAEFGSMLQPAGAKGYVSDLKQKTVIEVDDQRTRAAAVSQTFMGYLGIPKKEEEIKEFIADRPFVYFIRDDKTEQTLFIGEYAFAQ